MIYNYYEIERHLKKMLCFYTDHQKFVWEASAKEIKTGQTLLHEFSKDFPKPLFHISDVSVVVDQKETVFDVYEKIVHQTPFCTLLNFEKKTPDGQQAPLKNQPNVLLVAPLSGHYATLLRDTVKIFLKDHNVYITDWHNVRDIPKDQGDFHLSDYVQHLLDYLEFFQGNVHIIAVCQPVVPVLVSVSYASQMNLSKSLPKSMTLMGGPVDARQNPGTVNKFAQNYPLEWFQNHMIHPVPLTYEGAGRLVCPGFLMLNNFISLNFDRHYRAWTDYMFDLYHDNLGSVDHHTAFYDEYRSVMDLSAPYYLDCVDHVFQKFSLPLGKFNFKDVKIDLKSIEKVSLLTIEGEADDISPVGQTFAAHDLCTNIPHAHKHYYVQKEAGHYGIFSGHRFRDFIYPKIRDFINHSD